MNSCCRGYYSSSYYPDNPEDFTAQTIHENAFPIAFFRKVNDLVYYMVCKVEDGGYFYLFFAAKSGFALTDAELETSGCTSEFAARLYNPANADLAAMDLTKEVIWWRSVYSEKNIGTTA